MSKLKIENPFFRKLFRFQIVGAIVGLSMTWGLYKILDGELLD